MFSIYVRGTVLDSLNGLRDLRASGYAGGPGKRTCLNQFTSRRPGVRWSGPSYRERAKYGRIVQGAIAAGVVFDENGEATVAGGLRIKVTAFARKPEPKKSRAKRKVDGTVTGRIANRETEAALQAAERGDVARFDNVASMMADLNDEDKPAIKKPRAKRATKKTDDAAGV